MFDAEGAAQKLLWRCTEHTVPKASVLVEAHLGAGRIIYLPGAGACDGDLIVGEDGPYIRVRSCIPEPRRRWSIMNGLAQWHLIHRLGYCEDNVDAPAYQLTAALVMPRRAFDIVVRHFGEDFAAVAAAFVTTQVAAELRFAEITGEPARCAAALRNRVEVR